MNDEQIICASNNVDWYQAIFRSHGLTGEITDGIWISRDSAPPYYSNAVTVAPAGQAGQIARLRDLDGVLRGRWSVKDSFAVLDLSPLGFRPLFEAEWIWCDVSDAPVADVGGIAWRPVTTTDQLERVGGRLAKEWIAHRNPCLRAEPAGEPDDRAVRRLSRRRRRRGVRGKSVRRAVGFSNFFVEDGEEPLAVAGAIAEVARFGAGLPIVGYLAGERLAQATGLGFRSVGPLRIWVTGAR